MGFNLDTNTAAAASTNTAKGGFEKAIGFINISLPSTKGGTKKLGAIPLKFSNENEKALFDWLMADPERIQLLKNKIQMNFQAVESAATNGFDLS